MGATEFCCNVPGFFPFLLHIFFTGQTTVFCSSQTQKHFESKIKQAALSGRSKHQLCTAKEGKCELSSSNADNAPHTARDTIKPLPLLLGLCFQLVGLIYRSNGLKLKIKRDTLHGMKHKQRKRMESHSLDRKVDPIAEYYTPGMQLFDF